MSRLARRGFDALLPGDPETALLRSAHLPPEKAREAWRSFRAEAGDLTRFLTAERPRRKALAPLLYRVLRDRDLPLRDSERTYLKTAYFREQHRSPRYWELVDEVLTRLGAEGIEAIPLRGTAFGRELYADPFLRHTHDAELLVREESLARAARAVAGGGGWEPAPELTGEQGRSFVHASGLPVLLWANPFRGPHLDPPLGALWDRSRRVGGEPPGRRSLSAADHLLLVLGHAAWCEARESLLWVCDAVRLLASEEPDWRVLEETAARCRLRVPAHRMTAYLATELEAAVPEETLARLERGSRRVEPLERDAVLRSARAGPEGLGGLLETADGPADRARLLWRILLPSPAYLRRVARPDASSPAAVLYVERIFSYLGTRFG